MILGEQPGDQEDKQGRSSSAPRGEFWQRPWLTPASTARFSNFDVIFVPEEDNFVNQTGVKGIGEYRQFVADLKLCAKILAKAA